MDRAKMLDLGIAIMEQEIERGDKISFLFKIIGQPETVTGTFGSTGADGINMEDGRFYGARGIDSTTLKKEG
jgi:hypothetical protein